MIVRTEKGSGADVEVKRSPMILNRKRLSDLNRLRNRAANRRGGGFGRVVFGESR
jgi:hypothetical protein